jgi:large subunit ribosomal protein L25
MADHEVLQAEPREMLGKKVRRLRAHGILPATVYGNNVKPISVQVSARDFQLALKHAGRTQLIDLTLPGEPPRPVFVKQLTVDAKRRAIQHVEFYQANLRVVTHATVPLHFIGESQAVRDGGILLTLVDHVEIESLPDDIPAGIDVDISSLSDYNAVVHVSDLPLPAGATVLTPADDIVCKVDPPASEASVADAIADTVPLPTELGGQAKPADSVPKA